MGPGDVGRGEGVKMTVGVVYPPILFTMWLDVVMVAMIIHLHHALDGKHLKSRDPIYNVRQYITRTTTICGIARKKLPSTAPRRLYRRRQDFTERLYILTLQHSMHYRPGQGLLEAAVVITRDFASHAIWNDGPDPPSAINRALVRTFVVLFVSKEEMKT